MTVLSAAPARASTMGLVPELLVNLPEDLIRDLVKASRGDVSAFVAKAIEKELAHDHLSEVIERMSKHLGPPDEAQVAMFRQMIREVNGACGKEGEAAGSSSPGIRTT